MTPYNIITLVEFESIIDIDLGLLYMMKAKYNSKYLREGIVKSKDENFFKTELLLRPNINPLNVILKDEYIDSDIDELYRDILNKDYKDILYYSKPNAIYTMVYNYIKLQKDIIDVTILCKNELEQQLIKTLLGKDVKTIISEKKDVDTSIYDTFYIKDYYSALIYKNLNKKHIYILRYNFNLESETKREEIPLVSVSTVVGDINKILVATPYADFVIPSDGIN